MFIFQFVYVRAFCGCLGPVLTAVIWRTLPRYCVSGEAVDTVMALQSASKGLTQANSVTFIADIEGITWSSVRN